MRLIRLSTAILVGIITISNGSLSAASERSLFADPLDGSVVKGWRNPPTAFVRLETGGRAARFQRGTTYEASLQPWVGNESWDTYCIEVEVLPEKMWAGIDFHVSEDGTRAAGLTMVRVPGDQLAVELAGIWGKAGAWKLWPVGQRLAPHTEGSWVRMRVDLRSDVANVYLNGDAVATFFDLPFARGGVRLAAYAGSALFRNLRVARLGRGAVTPVLPDPWAEARAGSVLHDWEAGPPREKGYGESDLPEETRGRRADWTRIPVDGRGVVQLTALAGDHNTSGVVFARTTLISRKAETRLLKLTYTDHFSLWCNGKKVFEGPPRQWFHPDREKHGNSRLIPDQYQVEVPVLAGENELIVRSEVTEPFGWAFWIRDATR